MDQRPEQLKAKLTTFYNTGQKLNRKPGYEFLGRGGGSDLLDRLMDFVVDSSTAGGNSSFVQHFQSTKKRASLDHYHHFYSHSGMCAQLAFLLV